MIDFIEGTLAEKTPAHLTVDVGGVGFRLNIPMSTYEKVGNPGTKARLLTHLYVREDILQLYGFATQDERELFELLLTVSGIGPKVAQAILSGMSVSGLRQRVVTEDVKGLMVIPGLGRKMASRLVVELKDRLAGGAISSRASFAPAAAVPASPAEEATLALIALGLEPGVAHRRVSNVVRDGDGGMTIEEIIKTALRDTAP